ncbi:MAG TPA: hypothetical protein VF708_10835 [Pyrinomonadaceae bacterium]
MMTLPLNMDNQAVLTNYTPSYDEVERRTGSRIYGLFPATVRGIDARGEEFETKTVLDNISADVFCLRLKQHVEVGVKLHVIAHIHKAVVELRGTVSRAESQPDQACGIAVDITSFRFL